MKELNVLAESLGLYKEHRINNLGGAMVYYWSQENIERLKIEKLSHGLTPKQFTEAVSIALSFVSGYSILSTQVVHDLNKQD